MTDQNRDHLYRAAAGLIDSPRADREAALIRARLARGELTEPGWAELLVAGDMRRPRDRHPNRYADIDTWTHATVDPATTDELEQLAELDQAIDQALALDAGDLEPRHNGNGQTGDDPGPLAITPLSDIQPRRVHWLWQGRLAMGTLGLLAGREGLGKSTLAVDLAAQITRGTLPGEHHGTPKAVLVCATEDSFEHTIRPRFETAGADLDRVYRIERHTDTGDHPILLPDDLAGVETAAHYTDAALLILDPLISRLGALDSHKDAEVRIALEPLVAIAARANLAVVGLIHHNKTGATDPLDKVMGSKAFAAVARSVHTVIPDPSDETGSRRYFGTPKNNLGRSDLPTIAFTIEAAIYDTDEGQGVTGRIVWGDETDETIRSIMERDANGGTSREDDCVEAIRSYMAANGPSVPAEIGRKALEALGFRGGTLNRAVKRAVDNRKTGGPGSPWAWFEKSTNPPSDDHPATGNNP